MDARAACDECGVSEPFEIRTNKDGTVDEVVARNPSFFHLEQMDSGLWWMRVDMPDGRGIVVNFYSRGKIDVRAEVE